MEGCGGIVFVILLVAAISLAAHANARERARRAYQSALQRLKAAPADPDLREETLRLGRAYSQLTRQGRVALFDEVALMNDINAACAGASVSRAPLPPPPTVTIESRLARLAELRSQGLIDEAEYADRRRRILDEV